MSDTIITKDDKDKFNKELVNLFDKYKEINQKIKKMTSSIDSLSIENGISYLDAKSLLLGIYMKDILSYCRLKTKGKGENEKLIKRLVNLKVTQEKLKIIDNKLENQIKKYERLADGESQEYLHKPNLLNEDEDADEDNLEKEEKTVEEGKPKYKPSKQYFDFYENKDETNKRKKDIEKAKDKLRNSEYLNELRNEYSDKPEEIGDDFSKTHEGKYLKEVDKYERDYMTNVLVNKKYLKSLRKKDKKENDLNEITNELKHLSTIIEGENKLYKNERIRENELSKVKKKIQNEKSKFESGLKRKRNKK